MQEIGKNVSSWLPENRQTLEDFVGDKKGLALLFWSGICSHCQRYDRYLSSFEQRHSEIGFLAIACRQEETLENVMECRSKRRLGFRMIYDANRELAHRWKVNQTPRIFLIDRDLTLLYRGAIDNFLHPHDPDYAPYLEKAIAEFLKREPITVPETQSFGCAIESTYYTLASPTNR